jgi:hypothetical protein
LRFLAKKVIFLSKNTIFAIKMAKMTQIGQKLAKINFLALSNFLPHRFAIFSFLTILWRKMTQILAKKWILGLRGLRFGIPVTTLNINKMGISGWISLKFGICGLYTTKFCMKKIFSKKIFFWVKIEKSWIFSKKREKREKRYFLGRNAPNKLKICQNKLSGII